MSNFKKKFLIGTSLLLLAGSLIAVLLLWPDNSVKEQFGSVSEEELAAFTAKAHGDGPASEPIPERIELTRRVRLAIGSLGLPEQQTGNVSDLALTELNNADGLEMIERQELDKVLSELQLSAAGLVRAGDAVRAGKLLRADWFLLGTPAVVNGTNVSIVRVVDARTGVMHDATMLPSGLDTPALASKLVTFVRQARKEASQPRPRTYLAIGSFEDQGLNNRQAGLPGELRSYLTAAYQGSGVTMLEREFVTTLLKEMYLDLAGLTEENSEKAPARMQTAYWMLDGFYQSYETTNHQVELVFRLRRMFAPIQRFELREPPGDPLFRSVKSRIDQVLKEGRPALVFSRKAEIQTLLLNGEELIRNAEPYFHGHVPVQYEGTFRSRSEMARKVRNAEEAIRSLETVLLLDPTNREARVWLATCLRRNYRERLGEARDQYRYVIEAPIEDSWSKIARDALLRSFDWPEATPDLKKQWFENAARITTNPAAVEFYKAHAKRASEELLIERRGSTDVERLAEERLFEAIKSFNSLVHTGSGRDSPAMGMIAFSEALENDQPRVARHLNELFPKMKAEFPDLTPYLLISLIQFQVDTNAPVFVEFERMLDWCITNGEKVPQRATTFWSKLKSAYYWASEHKHPQLALRILEAISRAAEFDPKAKRECTGDTASMELAFCYMDCQRWSNALSIFETYNNHPVTMSGSGSWGAPGVILPGKQAALCRERLGLPKATNPLEFELGQPCLHLHPQRYWRSDNINPVIAVEGDGLWIGLNGVLMRLNSDLQTNIVVEVPVKNTAPFKAILVDSSRVWLGTEDCGLIEFDKASRESQRITEKDGLLMNSVSALCKTGDTLWIGYGSGFHGGLGNLNLKTRLFNSYGVSLRADTTSPNPPRSLIKQLRPGGEGEIWFSSDSGLGCYRFLKNAWEVSPLKSGVRVMCYEATDTRLIKGVEIQLIELKIGTKPLPGQTNTLPMITRVVTGEDYTLLQTNLRTNGSSQYIAAVNFVETPKQWALEVRSLKDGSERRLLDATQLPNTPTTLTLAESDLWVGGSGYVALVNLEKSEIKRIAYVAENNVDKIHLSGGYLWVQCDKHLYRARL